MQAKAASAQSDALRAASSIGCKAARAGHPSTATSDALRATRCTLQAQKAARSHVTRRELPAARHEQEAATLDGDGAIAEVAGIAENIEDVEREIFEPGCRYGDFDRSLAQVDCASVVSAIDENFPNPALFTRMSSMPNHVCIRSASADHACLRLCWKSGQGVKLIPTQGMDGNEDDEKALQRSAMLYRQRPSLTQITVHPCWSPRCWRRISAAGS